MKILITGGAGFIGIHAALRFASQHQIHIVDNLSRRGAKDKFSEEERENDSGYWRQGTSIL